MQKETFIIVGAGISGLVLAYELAGEFNITILEAAAGPGGRIHSVQPAGFPHIIEGGPEFIHGHLKHTIAYLKAAKIDYVPVEGKMYRKKNNRWVTEEDMIEGWDELLDAMKAIETDTTLADFLQQHFSNAKYSELCKQAIAYAEGFDLADTNKVSVKALYSEWANEEETNYRIPGGYCSLVNYLAQQCIQKGCRIIYNETVKQVAHKPRQAVITTANGNEYSGQKAAITIPISLLQETNAKAAIQFSPALAEYTAAAKNIGFGSLVKVLLLFKERFWKAATGFVITDERVRTWWTQLPDPTPLLTGWAGGPAGDALKDKPDEAIIEIALASLSNIYELPVEQLRSNMTAAKVFNWPANHLALGAYSYATPQTTAALQLLNTPVNDTLFFCGEGLYQDESPGTVEAAITSAKKLAGRLA